MRPLPLLLAVIMTACGGKLTDPCDSPTNCPADWPLSQGQRSACEQLMGTCTKEYWDRKICVDSQQTCSADGHGLGVPDTVCASELTALNECRSKH